ncbi:MAG TPA: M23 family peptidase, partial [Flavobacterium sp.]
YVYPLDAKTSVNHSKRPLLLHLSLQKNGTYVTEKVIANGKIGFGITAVDYDDVSFNKNGLFKVQSFLNEKPSFGYQFDTYSFDDMRYVNALIDYSKYKKTQQRVQRLFMKNKFGLSIIRTDENNGVISVVPDLPAVYRVEVSDFYGNKSMVSVPIQYDVLTTIIEPEPLASKYFVAANKDTNFVKDNMSVFFPAGTFYDDFDMNFDVRNNTLFLHEDTIPAHSNFTIAITDNKYTEAQRDKIFIGLLEDEKVSYNATNRKENVFTAKVKTLGKYTLVVDTVAPKITILKPIEGKWLSDQKTIQLTINDSLSGIKSYNGYLNGNWILFEYDNKTKKLIHNFSDGIVSEGANDLKVIVTDNVGNSTTFESHFFRSQKK